jgi:ATP-binding cassette subfamily C (CFTR/MRP) protein 2
LGPEDKKITIVNDKEKGTLTVKEKRFTGQVGWADYKFYFKTGGVVLALFSTFLFILSTFLRIAADWWVGQWSKNAFPNLSIEQHIYIYAAIAVLYIVFIVIKSITFGQFSSEFAYNVFKQLIWNILKRKLEFFDTTPSG